MKYIKYICPYSRYFCSVCFQEEKKLSFPPYLNTEKKQNKKSHMYLVFSIIRLQQTKYKIVKPVFIKKKNSTFKLFSFNT